MRKLIFILLFLFPALFLFSSPCYEDVENAAFSVILARTSIPTLMLDGVTFVGDDDEIIPDKIIFDNSDLSTYLDTLNTKPDNIPFWKIPLYNLTQNGATMKKTKKKLESTGYNKGDVVISGEVDIPEKSSINKLDYLTTGSLASLSVKCRPHLIIQKGGEEYIMEGTFNIEGDEEGTMHVYSDMLTLDGEFYRVDVKYRREKE